MKTSPEVCQETSTTDRHENCRPKPTKVAFMDLDGTLYSGPEYENIKRAFQEELARLIYYSKQKNGEKLPSLTKFTEDSIFDYNQKAAEVGFPMACLMIGGTEEITRQANKNLNFTHDINPNPDIRTLIEELRMSGFAIALVTGNMKEPTNLILKKILDDDGPSLFDAVITCDTEGTEGVIEGKPSSSPFEEAFKLLCSKFPQLVKPEEIWAIGDTFSTDIKPVIKSAIISQNPLIGVLIGSPKPLGPKQYVPPEDLDRVCILRELSRLGRFMAALEERSLDLQQRLHLKEFSSLLIGI